MIFSERCSVIGIDTSFLVAYELKEHRLHEASVAMARLKADEGFALASQVLAEFLHVTTDPRRLEKPLPMVDALDRAEAWWLAREVTPLGPEIASATLFLDWMRSYQIGRKRILDTQLAAVYRSHEVAVILTIDPRGFAGFPGLAPLVIS